MLIGIDLGTTFSAVAHVGENGQAEIIENRDGTRVMPSVVMFEDGAVVVGEQAKENSIVDPFGVCQFVKRQMGQKAFSFDVSENDHFSAKDISAMILKRLKNALMLMAKIRIMQIGNMSNLKILKAFRQF